MQMAAVRNAATAPALVAPSRGRPAPKQAPLPQVQVRHPSAPAPCVALQPPRPSRLADVRAPTQVDCVEASAHPVRALVEYNLALLDDFEERAQDRPTLTDLDRYFAMNKREVVKNIRAKVQEAFAGLGAYTAENPHMRDVVNAPEFIAWVTAPRSTQEALQMQITAAPENPGAAVMHHLRCAMLSMQILQEGWPENL